MLALSPGVKKKLGENKRDVWGSAAAAAAGAATVPAKRHVTGGSELTREAERAIRNMVSGWRRESVKVAQPVGVLSSGHNFLGSEFSELRPEVLMGVD